MILHYFIIAIRNLFRYKVQSVISVAGLAIGFTFFIFGLQWLKYETSYDSFYPASKQIYKVYGIDKESGKKLERIPLILARKLKQDFPEITDNTLIYSNAGSNFKYGDKVIGRVDEQFIDEQFFQLFPSQVICGRTENLLRAHDEIVITESFARKYFGTPEKALDQVMSNGYRKVLNIVAVIKDSPVNSVFQREVYELDFFDRRQETQMSEDKNWNLFSGQLFILLDKRTDIAAFKKKIYTYAIDHKYNDTFYVDMVPLTAVRHTFGSELSFNITYIRTFAASALLLLFCVFFNFINLLLNRILQRNKEMKLRNAIGASRGELMLQLQLELSVQLFLAFILTFIFLEVGNAGFSRMFETEIVKNELFSQFATTAFLSWIFLSVISLFPIFRFVNFSSLIASGGVVQVHKQGLFRKISIGLQLVICVFFFTSAFILYRQVDFMTHKDLGFEKEGLIQMTMGARKRTEITQEIATLSLVKMFIPTGLFNLVHDPNTENAVEWEGKQEGQNPMFQIIEVGANFLEGFKIPLLQGRFVTPEDMVPLDGQSRFVCSKAVINQKAAQVMGMQDPIGKKIRAFAGWISGDGTLGMTDLEIVGVVKDFHTASLRNSIAPVIIKLTDSEWEGYYNYVRVEPGTEQAALKAIKNVFQKHASVGERESKLICMTELLDDLNKSEQASLRLFSVLAVLCILISIFGIYSISSSNMEKRKKEIAIRKVSGASTFGIVGMFFKEYTWIVLGANLIAFPLSWIFTSRWLEQYPYRIELEAWLFLLVFLVTTALVILTVLHQVVKAARKNPAEVVKSE